MPVVTRLVTHVELDEAATTASQLSVSARLDAELSDGRTVVLLDDRGWSGTVMGGADLRDFLTAADIEDTARMVVGPDEPFGDETREQTDAAHWAALAARVEEGAPGVRVVGAELAALTHAVVLGDGLRRWAGLDAPKAG